ncbi:lytic murein transglycosylase [Desulfobulbus sp. US1]|nr:lytic murein transglycosylase [Desulfobulbus sp. US1]
MPELDTELDMMKQVVKKFQSRSLGAVAILFLCLSGMISSVHAEVAESGERDPAFQGWLKAFAPRAAKQGISRDLYQQAFAGITAPDNEVLRKAAFQPEFTTEIWDYLDTAVNAVTVAQGRVVAKKHRAWLDRISARFGVEAPVLLAIWSIESRYGAVLERPGRLHYVPQALATLAYGDKNRRRFGEQQLLAALQIVRDGDVALPNSTAPGPGLWGIPSLFPPVTRPMGWIWIRTGGGIFGLPCLMPWPQRPIFSIKTAGGPVSPGAMRCGCQRTACNIGGKPRPLPSGGSLVLLGLTEAFFLNQVLRLSLKC